MTASDVHRFADFAIHPTQPHLIISILEDHTNPNPADVVTTFCLINAKTKTVHPLLSGADFYAAPAFSPDGTHLVWQQWNHPDMPWEGGEIYFGKAKYDATDDSVAITDAIHVGGKYKEVSATLPFWVTNDTLVFTSDVSGFQNPWIYTISAGKAAPILPQPVKEDFSLPPWLLGRSYGAVVHPGDDANHSTVLYTGFRDGRSRLYLITLHSGAIEELVCPYVEIGYVRRIADGHIVFIGSKVDEDPAVVLCSLKDYSTPHFTTCGKVEKTSTIPANLISKPQSITLSIPPTNEPLYVMYYAPTNPDYQAPEGELPPAVIRVHGGPTDHEVQSLAKIVQFFTSRGYAWYESVAVLTTISH